MVKRASLSKRTRFSIFERDSFTCQYCGLRPPETVLQLDHIHPVSKGGEDTEENLVTSCVECNAGKSNRVLGAVVPRPDSDAKYLHAQQEIMEAQLYLEAKQRRDQIYEQLVDLALKAFDEQISYGHRPERSEVRDWLLTYGPEELDYAIRIAGRKRYFQGLNGAIRYIGGILSHRAKDGEDGGEE